jgi:hypothetical protein
MHVQSLHLPARRLRLHELQLLRERGLMVIIAAGRARPRFDLSEP